MSLPRLPRENGQKVHLHNLVPKADQIKSSQIKSPINCSPPFPCPCKRTALISFSLQDMSSSRPTTPSQCESCQVIAPWEDNRRGSSNCWHRMSQSFTKIRISEAETRRADTVWSPRVLWCTRQQTVGAGLWTSVPSPNENSKLGSQS